MAPRRMAGGPALLLAALLLGSPAFATGDRFPELEAVGRALHEKDRAARLATDRLVEANGGVPDGVAGWVTVPSGDRWRVIFVEETADTSCSRWSVPVDRDGAGALVRSPACKPLTREQRAMFLARRTALAALRARCSDRYNTVVLPHEGEGAAWVVYLLAATEEPGEVVLGGHVRVLVAEGGRQLVDYRPLSNACMTLDTRTADGRKPAALVSTHVLDDHPIETHVFVSLQMEVKLYVMTESAMWRVADGEIDLLMDGEDYRAYLGRAESPQPP